MFIRQTAEDFLNAFHILKESNDYFAENFSSSSVNISDFKAFGTLPSMGVEVVCLAFSAELYIKSLHYEITKKATLGHNILTLFRQLPEHVQQQIFRYPSVAEYGWSFAEFEREIEAVSDGFQKWRYSHEFTPIRYNSYFALVFIEAIKHVFASAIDQH